MTTVGAPGRRLEIGIVLLLFLGVSLASRMAQSPISYNGGRGWDGEAYCDMATQFATGTPLNADAPFVYRVGVPFVVSALFGTNVLAGFKAINVVASALTVVLLVWWLRLHVTAWWARTAATSAFILMWHGPVRFVYYYAAGVDPWLLVVLLAGMIAIERGRRSHARRWLAVSALVLGGVLVREAALLVGLAAAVASLDDTRDRNSASFWQRRIHLEGWAPLAVGLLALVILHAETTATTDESLVRTAVSWAVHKPLWRYVLAWFIAYGPVLVLPVVYWRWLARFLSGHGYLAAYLVGVAVVAWIGGADTERFLSWGAPVVYLVIAKLLEDAPVLANLTPTGATLLVAAQALADRLFWTVPDYPNAYPTPVPVLTILSSRCQFLDLWSYHGAWTVEAMVLAEYLAISAALVWWLRHRGQNVRVAEHGAQPGVRRSGRLERL